MRAACANDLREVKVSCLWVTCEASGARQTFKPVQEPQPGIAKGGARILREVERQQGSVRS